jgi:anti-sigma factor RsiW
MMTCRELVELLGEFLSGELPPEQRGHVERHLDGCDGCIAYLESYHLTVHLSRQLPSPCLPPRLRERLEEILREEGGRAAPELEA